MTDQRERVRDAYDDLAETHFAERSDRPPEATLLDEVRDRIDADARVLDAGCGQGTPVSSALAPQYDVVGLDFATAQLRLADGVVPRARLVQGDMTELPLAADSFDAVCAFHSIIHVPVADHANVLSEFARVLRPGGVLLVSSGGTDWAGSNPDWLDSGVEMEWSFPGPEETRRLLSAAGFNLQEWWIVTDRLGREGDGAVLDPDGDDAYEDGEPVGKPFFLAVRR
ncbi:Methyltransferase domain-containing protein [Natronoarchaeum philippinense]|uniref:Methyltransferase domain-containing protein n=1 Tax=Natronoarchaeum philippinense TaxID=558529 RepID=A0A285N9W8_NATPI|nr:class I SAM-dependent methyltransferase [Natronoarchaeum philippinense]SNZ05703.1 Methyltransferase domain-containing protein [Natronoarchaeum philippinense]